MTLICHSILPRRRYIQYVGSFSSAKDQLRKQRSTTSLPAKNQSHTIHPCWSELDFRSVWVVLFWPASLQREAQFDRLVELPESEDLRMAIPKAMESIENDYTNLEGLLPKEEYQELDMRCWLSCCSPWTLMSWSGYRVMFLAASTSIFWPSLLIRKHTTVESSSLRSPWFPWFLMCWNPRWYSLSDLWFRSDVRSKRTCCGTIRPEPDREAGLQRLGKESHDLASGPDSLSR